MRTEPRPAKNQIRLARHKLRDARTSCPQIKPRLEEKAGGGTEQRRTANTARKGETSQISPVGAGTPHQQTPTAETRTQIRGFDPRKHTPYVREHQETPNTSLQRQRQANGIGGGFAYLIMSNADAGFDGLDEATSRATATASAEPRIESASSTPPPGAGSTIAGALLPLSRLGVSPYRSTISADQADERSQGTKVLAKSDG